MPGFPPYFLADPPIHIAAPIPRVNVGVTKTRRKFAFASTQSIPPAPFEKELVPQAFGLFDPPTRENLSARRMLVGQTVGIQRVQGDVPHVIVIGKHVSALNIGKPSSTLSPSHFGFPKIDGSEPGASGAQFTGKLIQDPPQNPHDIESARFFAIVFISLAELSESHMSTTFPPAFNCA